MIEELKDEWIYGSQVHLMNVWKVISMHGFFFSTYLLSGQIYGRTERLQRSRKSGES